MTIKFEESTLYKKNCTHKLIRTELVQEVKNLEVQKDNEVCQFSLNVVNSRKVSKVNDPPGQTSWETPRDNVRTISCHRPSREIDLQLQLTEGNWANERGLMKSFNSLSRRDVIGDLLIVSRRGDVLRAGCFSTGVSRQQFATPQGTPNVCRSTP